MCNSSSLYFTPTRDATSAARSLEQLLRRPAPAMFQGAIRRLHDRSTIYATTCPAPLPALGLIVTPEIRCQSELYLPIAEITVIFNRLYRLALTYPPILSSTPFYHALSWADVAVALPPRFQFTANPARLLDALLANRALLVEFLIASFLPRRFYGGLMRYPLQEAFIREWLATLPLSHSHQRRGQKRLRCLDAASGDGAGSYGVARLLLELGWAPDRFEIEGWTLEPLEAWAAAHAAFPHDPQREGVFRRWAEPVFEQEAHTSLTFRTVDLGQALPSQQHPAVRLDFDLIICNGLLGGPIVNRPDELRRIVSQLVELLAPGGLLLAADHFHGGWKQQCPQKELRVLFEMNGLKIIEAEEGLAAQKS
ncbi:MAG: chemotaxis protein CheR [Desulfuromonadales bacterium]|nr:chemotaxis protein CheR [Desulfuromonadales bacterium]